MFNGKPTIMALLGLTVSAVLLSGCTTPKTEPSKAVSWHTPELQQVMRQLNSAVQSHEHQSPLDIEDAQRRNASRLANQVIGLSAELERINPQFQNHARQLKQQAEIIHVIADSYQMEILPDAIRDLNAICVQCHAKFRNP